MDDRPILGRLDVAQLTDQGLLGPAPSPGSRRIHKRRFNRSSDDEHFSIPLDIGFDSPGAEDAFAIIPTAIISFDALLYLGLTAKKSNSIWAEWTSWPDTGPRCEVDPDNGGLQVPFIDFVVGPLHNFDDVYKDNDDKWVQCLSEFGISEPLQNAIMDPSFMHVRMNNSCVYWILDTIMMRYRGLEDISRASREREMKIMRAAGRSGGTSSGSGGAGEGSSSSSGVPVRGRRSISAMQQQAIPKISHITWNSAASKSVADKPGKITLYKGMDQGRIESLFDGTGNIKNIGKLLTSPPSDFSGTRALFYFNPDQRVAEDLAAYAKRRANCESIVMVCVSIQESDINGLEESQIQRLSWPSPQWKQLVWRSKTARALPRTLHKYRNAVLVIGTISKGADRRFQEMETWKDMTDAYVLHIESPGSSGPAVQYAFSGEEEGRDFLTEHGDFSVFEFTETRRAH